MSPSLAIRIVLPFALGYFLSYLYRSLNAVIAPDLIRDIGLDAGILGLLTSAYFLTFAAFQLPLGILLDRFGPRRCEAALLLFAALGALVFAQATSASGLIAGRALIGLGVSACLMAAFKAIRLWFPEDRLPLVNGIQMAAGGLGALTATAPVEFALHLTDWRGVFLILAALTIAVALLVFTLVPERAAPSGTAETLGEAIGGIGTVFTSSNFWRLAPLTIMSQASMLAIQGLWSGPWLRDVAGFERDGLATVLLMIAAAMVTGFLGLGGLAERLGRNGIPTVSVAVVGMSCFMIVQACIIIGWHDAAVPLWILFGFTATAGILPYSVLPQFFSAQLSGRVITALNMLVFGAAFAFQWGIGAVIDFWPKTTAGGFALTGYRAGFGMVLALQVAALAWFLLAPRFTRRAA